jgi:hypothetical protein
VCFCKKFNRYKVLTFTHDGSSANHTEYTVNFPENTTCDILVVGGGGGGGSQKISSSWAGAGGGAGGLIFLEQQTISANTQISIRVGKGGNGSINFRSGSFLAAQNGHNTVIEYGTNVITALGGGSGGSRRDGLGGNGGSGGGSALDDENYMAEGLQPSQTGLSAGFGNKGGGTYNTSSGWVSGGGGGAGSEGGGENFPFNDTGDATGFGGEGKDYSAYFGTDVGDNGWFAGGGGAGNNVYSPQIRGVGGIGGGGNGNSSFYRGTTLEVKPDDIDGTNNTGGGGGGTMASHGGNGGSGVVIIRYSMGTTTTTQVTYNYKTDGILKYIAGDQNAEETRNTGSWEVVNVNDIIPTQFSDLTGNIPYSTISDPPPIPTQFSDLTGTIPYSTISNPPAIPTQLSQLSGTIPWSSITGHENWGYLPKSHLVHHLDRYDPITVFLPGGITGSSQYYITQKFDLGTNLILNEYNRPQLNYRYWMSITPDSTDNYDGRRYWFGIITYNQGTYNSSLNYPAFFHVETLATNFDFIWINTYWNNVGNNYIRIEIQSDQPVYKLNVNIS